MSEQSDGYRLFVKTEDEYSLAPTSFGIFQKVRMGQLKCTAVGIKEKLAILQQFNLLEEKDKYIKHEYGVEGLYVLYLDNLFLDLPEKYDIKELDTKELARAVNFFFE